MTGPRALFLAGPTRRHLPAVREALLLRHWALDLLRGGGGTAPVPQPSAEAWSLFLRTEGCAGPLVERLSARRAPVPEVLREAALRESQRSLGARRELRILDGLAVERGWGAVVLKGGAAAAEGRVLEIGDVDLLVQPAEAKAWDAALRARGRTIDASSVPRVGLGHHHPLGTHREEGALLVELHTAIPHAALEGDPMASSVPLPGCRALRALAAADQAWHVIVHATVHHPERRGRLRDLVLAAWALARLAPDARAVLRRRAAGHRVAAVAAALELAGGLALGTAAPDPFRPFAVLRYLLRAEPDRLPSDPRAAAEVVRGAAYGCARERAAYVRRATGRGLLAPLSWGARALRLLQGAPWATLARRVVLPL